MIEEVLGVWECGVGPGAQAFEGPRFLAVAAVQMPESAVRHHLMVRRGSAWDSVAEFTDSVAAAATVATLEELGRTLMCVRIGGEHVMDEGDGDHPGVEWVAFEGAPAMPGEDVPPISARAWIVPTFDAGEVVLMLPKALPDRAVAHFYDAAAADVAVDWIDGLTRPKRRGLKDLGD